MVNVDDPFLHIEVAERQAAELRNAHPGMKQDIEDLVVFAVAIIVVHEFEELPHLVLRDGLSRHAIIDHYPGKLK